MNLKPKKIMTQGALIGVACFLLWVSLTRAWDLNAGLRDVELSNHGNIALILTVVFGVLFGMGLAVAFFILARQQTRDENDSD